MNKKNIFFVSLMCIAALAGNGFCAKVQDNFKELKTNIAAFAKEDVKALGDVLRQEQQQSEVLDQVGAKLAKVKQQYPDSTKTIDAVFFAIKDLISRRGATPEFYAQNLITPLERDLSPALIDLRNQNSGAFYATMSVIDVVYPTQRGNASLSDIIDFVDGYLPFEGSRVKDTDYLIYSLTADSKKDALWMFEYLMKKEPEFKNTTEIVMQQFKCVVNNYNKENFDSKDWAQTAEGCLEDLASLLATVSTLNHRLYGKIMGIMNRKYTAINGHNYSISEFKDFVNEKMRCYIIDDYSGLVFDGYGIFDKLNAYEK